MKNIVYIGQFKDASGYGNAARGYLFLLDKKLDKSLYNLNIISLNFEKQEYISVEDKNLLDKYELLNPLEFCKNNKYTLIVHGLPNYCEINLIKNLLNNKNCEKKINFVAWETDNIPKQWKKIYEDDVYDELVVFSKWNKEIFSKSFIKPIHIIPHVILDFYDLNKKNNNKFNIFSMSQWSNRKGFDILLKAYYQEFFNNEDVELFIKTYRNETMSGIEESKEREIIINDITKIKNSIRDYGNLPKCKVSLKTGFVDKKEIKSYYEKADVYCSPSRGEGFGMTIAQAALSGIPCIVPDLGGHIDYLDPNNTYWIKSIFEPVYDLSYNIYSSIDMNFIEPELKSTRNQLRKAYNNWKTDKLNSVSDEYKTFTRNYLSEDKIFNKFMEMIC